MTLQQLVGKTLRIQGFGLLAILGVSAQAGLPVEVSRQADQARRHLYSNLQHPKAKPGAVIASPSGTREGEANYLFHWVRDAALVMQATLSDKEGERLFLRPWISFERLLQSLNPPSGDLGEPKYMIDGTAFTGPWGRPQNDGPALRAVTGARLAKRLLRETNSNRSFVQRDLYDSRLPTNSMVKKDLEYVARTWRDPSYDLWEEVKGDHFYTRITQQAALLEGAELAEMMNDGGAAAHYRREAKLIGDDLNRFWDAPKGYFQITRNRVSGWDHKKSGLDVAVILGLLHAYGDASPWKATDGRMLSTALKLEETFRALYPINRDRSVGVGIGRYPEDVYDGVGFDGGNPWFLATQGFAEYHCRAAQEIASQEGKVKLDTVAARAYARLFSSVGKRPSLSLMGATLERSSALSQELINLHLEKAQGYFARVLRHRGAQDRMSEQFRRDNGFMQGAFDLTWSYASFMTAAKVCDAIMPEGVTLRPASLHR